MTGFLLAISFIIHILTLLSLIIVWKKSGAAEQQDLVAMKKEMEDILLAYTAEMKAENEAFLIELADLDRNTGIQHTESREIELEKEDKTEPVTQVEEPNTTEPFEEEEIDYIPPIEEQVETFGPSMASRVLSMQAQGFSLDEIAKKVNKGKGEVELMLKLYRDGQ